MRGVKIRQRSGKEDIHRGCCAFGGNLRRRFGVMSKVRKRECAREVFIHYVLRERHVTYAHVALGTPLGHVYLTLFPYILAHIAI